MFVLWNELGTKVPYRPGSLRDKKVEKIQKPASIQNTKSHMPNTGSRGSSSDSGHLADAYHQPDMKPIVRQPALLAQDIMTSPVYTLSVTTSLVQAWGMIRQRRFRHIPVLSTDGNLVGILSDRDLFRASIEYLVESDLGMDQVSSLRIERIMVTNVLSASPKTKIREIARIFFQERIGAMPLVNDHDELVGILTRSDILRTVVNEAPFELWV